MSSAVTGYLRTCRIRSAIFSLAVSYLSPSDTTVLLAIVMFWIFLLICYWSYLKARNTLLVEQVGKLELNNNYANLKRFMALRSPAEVHLKPVSFDEVALCSKEGTASLYGCCRNAAWIIFLVSATRQKVGLWSELLRFARYCHSILRNLSVHKVKDTSNYK